MSNFLERIAASAALGQSQARPQLQPLPGSMFAPAALPATAPGPVPMDGSAAAAAEIYSESVTGRPAVGGERLFPSVYGNKFSSANSASPQGVAPFDDGPLLPGEDNVEERTSARRDIQRSAKAHLSEVAKNDSDERTDAQQFRPLVPSSATPVQSLRAAPPARVDPSRQASTRRSEPDEIHIHIGRIEVAAVAPPAPRAAAAAPRKGINLDEYLRRGSGGQR